MLVLFNGKLSVSVCVCERERERGREREREGEREGEKCVHMLLFLFTTLILSLCGNVIIPATVGGHEDSCN